MNDRACLLAAVLALCVSGCSLSTDETDDENATVEGEESSADALTASDYPTPNLSADQKAAVFARYQVDPSGVVPKALLVDAVAFYDFNKERLKNRSFLTVVDFSKHSGKQRLFVVNMTSGAVSSYVVAHGSGSDPGNTGFATKFSNVENSNQTSLGYYVTGETYNGKHGNSMRLDGVSTTDSHARARAIVMHGADYVSEGRSRQGRSWGCLALPPNEKDGVIAKLKGGSVIFAARPN
jgi:L,D-transpeptidase catalytic domain